MGISHEQHHEAICVTSEHDQQDTGSTRRRALLSRVFRSVSSTDQHRLRAGGATHPLLVQLQQLLRDLRGADGQPQTLDVQFRDDVFQHLFERKATSRPMPRCRWDGVLQNGSPERGQLEEKADASGLVILLTTLNEMQLFPFLDQKPVWLLNVALLS